MEKKTILHFIDRLGRGGAEMLLVNTIKELKEYRNIVVIIGSDNRFENELECDELIKLNIQSIFLYWLAIFKVRSIIKKEKVDLVHAHLFWPNIISRFATPRKIPLINSIHAFIANSLEYKIGYVRWLEKISYTYRKPIISTVAKGALTEFFSFLNLKPGRSFVNYTFADVSKFHNVNTDSKKDDAIIRIVSVGALRAQKNYSYLMEAFEPLKGKNIELDIYGSGPLESEIESKIKQLKVRINLKGEVKNISEILPRYDFFTLSSTYEGFSIAVLEAMAMKLPLLLSNIPSFIEQCADTAVYFDINDTGDFSKKLLAILDNVERRQELSERAFIRMNSNFTIQDHTSILKQEYSNIFNTVN